MPQTAKEGMRRHFFSAKNSEWSRHGNYYEAIFYHHGLEKIARFSSDGELLEHRVNLPLEKIPAAVSVNASAEGEIMNCIEIHTEAVLTYEFIVRDKSLNRYLLLTDDSGIKVRKVKL